MTQPILTQTTYLVRMFSFKGRIRRSEYLIWSVLSYDILLILELLLRLLVHPSVGVHPSLGMWFVIWSVQWIAFFWFALASAVKRSHDLGRNGFRVLIPFYGLWLLFADSVTQENKYGVNPKEAENSKPLTYGLPVFWAILILSACLALLTPRLGSLRICFYFPDRKLVNAAESGDTSAQYKLGSYCRDIADGSIHHFQLHFFESMKWFRTAADQGHTEAQYNLGLLYEKGTDVTQLSSTSYRTSHKKNDAIESMKWFRTAAEQGHAAAQCEMGSKARDGVEKVMWYRKAADQGYSEALRQLWVIYYNREYDIKGVVAEDGEAMEWKRKYDKAIQTEEESAAKKDAEKRLVK